MKINELKPIYVKFPPKIDSMREGELYILATETPSSIHLCPCGCKNIVVLPHDKDGWKLTDKNGKITMRPSVGSFNLPCKSHYYITDNKVEWL